MSNELAIIENIGALNAVVVFAPGGVEDVLAKLKTQARNEPSDISTAKGRDAIKSLAYKIARSKTALDDLGKQLTADLKKQTGAIDVERKRIRDELDALKDEIRKPLDDFESAEELRIKDHEDAISAINSLVCFADGEITSATIQQNINYLCELPDREWQEFSKRADDAKLEVSAKLNEMLAAAIKYEADQAELERLRAEKVEADRLEAIRLQAEREATIAREAAENARIAAEQKAERDAGEYRERVAMAAKEAAEKAEAERIKLHQEKEDAYARAEKAEIDAMNAAAKAEIEAKNREEEAASNERKKIEDAKAVELAEIAAREANKKHRAAVNNAAVDGFISAGLDKSSAKLAVVGIATGLVPNIRISY